MLRLTQLPEVWLALADTCAKSPSLRHLVLRSCGIGDLGELRRAGCMRRRRARSTRPCVLHAVIIS